MNPGTRIPRKVLLFSCLALLMVSQVAAGPAWTYRNVSDPSLFGMTPHLSGDYLAYSGSIGDPLDENSTRVVQLLSLPTGKEIRVATAPPRNGIQCTGIDGNYAVLFTEPDLEAPVGIPDRIFLYAIREGTLTSLNASASAAWPRISGKTIIWTENPNGSFTDNVVRYDIGTGKTTPVPGIRVVGGSDVALSGDHILYQDTDTMDLRLYSLANGTSSTVFAPRYGNVTREDAYESALGGDYVLYRKDVWVENPRGTYSELCLYAISTGTTSLLSPVTGKAVDSLSDTERNAVFNIGAADADRVVWVVAEGIANDRIVVLDPETGAVSSVSPGSNVNDVSLDGGNLTWEGTTSLFGKGVIYLGTESGGQDNQPAATSTARASGFGLAAVFGGLVAGLALAGKVH
ncbi:MAG: hypothetical protein ABFC24_03930 [Methanoregulaceae archaeon]